MKLTAILLLAAFLQVSARTKGQTVTLKVKDAPMKEVFRAIQQQTGLDVLVDVTLLDKVKPVTLDVTNMPVSQVLNLCFKNEPLTYTITDSRIVVKSKSPLIQTVIQGFSSPPIDISWRITDTEGKPLEGANIKVKGTNIGTTTNADGIFILKNVDDDATLEISYVGFQTQFIPVNNRSSISLALKRSDNPLDEVQVIAYGTTSRRLNVGNVSTVKAADIEKAPVGNVLLAIQGRVPGIFIEQATGVPGSSLKVQVQGQNSILNGNDPLYVIDGVPYPAQMLQSSSQIQLGGNPLNFLNPQDIESIDILKDAEATSIYGSRAANGAILITTKKGKAGQTNVNVNFQTGIGQVAKKLDMMNTQQYLDMRKEAYVNDGLPVPDKTTVPDGTNYDLTFWDPNRYTDWQKVLIGNPAHYTDAQASVSGGNANTTFLLGTNYHRETTVFPGDFADQKGSVYFNASQFSNNQKLHVQFSSSYMADNTNLPNYDLTQPAVELAPNAPALYNQDGTLNWASAPDGTSSWYNPAQYTVTTYTNAISNLLANADIRYDVMKNVSIGSTFGFNTLTSNEKTFFPQTYFPPEYRINRNNRSANYSDSKNTTWNIEPQIKYHLNKEFGKFDLLLGTTFQRTTNDLMAFMGQGYASDAQLENISAATTLTATTTLQSVYNYNALFGRIRYNYRDKYLIDLSSRRDGSSRFGPKNLFHNFSSVGGAWIFSSEPWTDKGTFLSFGKLRLSYGTSGNDQIGDYNFMSLYNIVYAEIPYGGGTGLSPANLYNPYLQWEETRKLNLGIDLGFIRDHITLGLNWYRNRSSNELLGYALPITTGFGNINQNFDAKVQNTGFEFTLNTQNITSKNFQWTSNINLTVNRNKLLEFPGLATSSFSNILVIGKPLNNYGAKLFHFVGVDSATGDYQFQKADKTLTNFPEYDIDQTILPPNLTPKYYGGFQNTITYKGFSLDILLQFVNQKGLDPFRFGATWPGLFDIVAEQNQPVTMIDHWKKAGDSAPFGKFTNQFPLDYFYLSSSDALIVDASYIRLKNISLSWNLPRQWISKIHFQNLKVYLQGQNILTITHYQGLDPESRSVTSLPPLRVITAGIQVGL